MATAVANATMNVQASAAQGTLVEKPQRKKQVNVAGIVRVCMRAVVGAIVAVVGSKLCEMLEGKHERHTLDPKPENFDVDPAAYNLLRRLQRWKKYNREDFINCIYVIDSFLQIEANIAHAATGKIRAVKRAEQLFFMACNILHSFEVGVRQYLAKAGNHSPKEVLRLEYDVNNLRDFLYAHLDSVYYMTSLISV